MARDGKAGEEETELTRGRSGGHRPSIEAMESSGRKPRSTQLQHPEMMAKPNARPRPAIATSPSLLQVHELTLSSTWGSQVNARADLALHQFQSAWWTKPPACFGALGDGATSERVVRMLGPLPVRWIGLHQPRTHRRTPPPISLIFFGPAR